jgi:hypothetical protein
MADLSIFNNIDLLTNIRTAPVSMNIGGINAKAGALLATEIGDFEPLGITAYYHTHAAANVLCFYDVNRHVLCILILISDTLKHPSCNHSCIFTPLDDLSEPYHKLYRSNALGVHLTGVAMTTLAEIEHDYTKRRRESVKVARTLSNTLSYPSDRDLSLLISSASGALNNSPITAQNVQRATPCILVCHLCVVRLSDKHPCLIEKNQYVH